MQQLKMYKTDGVRADETLPAGYTFATHCDAYIDRWISVMNGSISDAWTAEKFHMSMLDLPGLAPEGIFYVFNDKSEAVATAAGMCDYAGDVGTGQLHMVAVKTEHRGLRLGAIVSAKAIDYLYDKGMRRVMLTTDDFRLAAVKIYLDLNFIPVLHDDTMRARWVAVVEKLGRSALPAYENDIYIENII